MIKLLDQTCQVVETFRSSLQLFTYLQENSRHLDEQEREKWRLVTYSYKTLARILKELRNKSFADMAHKACQQEQNMIIMCIGDANNPFIFLETPGLEVAELWNQWCSHYCQEHNFQIVVE